MLKEGFDLDPYRRMNKRPLIFAHFFAAFELLIPLQRPSKPLHRILSKHTKQRIPTFSSLQSGNFPIKQTAPSGLTTYLTFHIIEISTIAGELVKFGNYLQTALFFSKRKEMKRSSFPQRMYQRISVRPTFKRGWPMPKSVHC